MAIPKVVDKGVPLPEKVDTDSREGGYLEVTLDTPIEKVIESDEKGWKVTFSDEPGKFKRLSDTELDKLHRVTQAAYLVSERYHQAALDKANNPRAVLTDIQQNARATDRLLVRNKRPGTAYSWKRPDEYQRAVGYEGWKVSTDPKLETFRKPTGGAFTVGAKGDDELILFERPQDLHDAHLREATEKSERRRGTAQRAAVAGDKAFFEEGNTRLDPKGKKWEDVVPQGEST